MVNHLERGVNTTTINTPSLISIAKGTKAPLKNVAESSGSIYYRIGKVLLGFLGLAAVGGAVKYVSDINNTTLNANSTDLTLNSTFTGLNETNLNTTNLNQPIFVDKPSLPMCPSSQGLGQCTVGSGPLEFMKSNSKIVHIQSKSTGKVNDVLFRDSVRFEKVSSDEWDNLTYGKINDLCLLRPCPITWFQHLQYEEYAAQLKRVALDPRSEFTIEAP